MGRPTSYTTDMADAICDRLCDGESLRAICKDEGMPPMGTVMRWLSVHEDFREQYARAREAQGEVDADLVGDIGLRVARGELEPQAARVAMDAAKWSASKRLPKKYGDKLDLNHGGSVSYTILTGVEGGLGGGADD